MFKGRQNAPQPKKKGNRVTKSSEMLELINKDRDAKALARLKDRRGG